MPAGGLKHGTAPGRFVLALLCILAAPFAGGEAVAAGPETEPLPPFSREDYRQRLGCTHVNGQYHFTDRDFLNEGADRLLEAGFGVIKLYLHDPRRFYRFNTRWPDFASMVEIARHPLYEQVFRKPFHTYVLTAYEKTAGEPHDWRRGFSEEDARRTRAAFEELTVHLLRTWKGTGKTFVLQNWEGDWALRGNFDREPAGDPSPAAIQGMIRWLNARQEGVHRGRTRVRSDVRVYHACEVNLVELAMQGRRTVTNDVLPHTRCDLYSYSAYDTIGAMADDPAAGRELFRRALDYLASKAPDSKAFGDRNVYIGEFGWPQVPSEQDPTASEEKHMRVVRGTVETALAWGCPWVIYWQLYDNESRAGRAVPTNDQVRGFYLIRPDGSPAPTWDYFFNLLKGPAPAQTAPPGESPSNP